MLIYSNPHDNVDLIVQKVHFIFFLININPSKIFDNKVNNIQ